MSNLTQPIFVKTSLRARFRHWRREIKSRMPYVRRRVYTRSLHKYEQLTEMLAQGISRNDDARITELKAPPTGRVDELCLFLSFQPGPTLKPHVRVHVEALLARGVPVVLVINAVLPADQLQLDPAFVARLSGLFVRENLGYDFAGWAHAYGLVTRQLRTRRLYLINDSIFGPFDDVHFDEVIKRIRGSGADMVGLTEAMQPRPHLQSFFLVFNERILTEAMGRFFHEVLNFADKSLVIDVYETRMTERMRAAGYRCEPVFRPLAPHNVSSNDPYHLWCELIEAGFPFLKVSVMQENADHPLVRRLVTDRFTRAD